MFTYILHNRKTRQKEDGVSWWKTTYGKTRKVVNGRCFSLNLFMYRKILPRSFEEQKHGPITDNIKNQTGSKVAIDWMRMWVKMLNRTRHEQSYGKLESDNSLTAVFSLTYKTS